jgi:hypothetical protein
MEKDGRHVLAKCTAHRLLYAILPFLPLLMLFVHWLVKCIATVVDSWIDPLGEVYVSM